MTTWVRHRWSFEDVCCEGVGESYVEEGSAGDEQLQRCFDSTREVGVDAPRNAETRLMNGWIRFG